MWVALATAILSPTGSCSNSGRSFVRSRGHHGAYRLSRVAPLALLQDSLHFFPVATTRAAGKLVIDPLQSSNP